MNVTPLWSPSAERRQAARLTRFAVRLGHASGADGAAYQALWQWSIDQPEAFWRAVWDDLAPVAATPPERILDRPTAMPGAQWFTGARFNFAEQLLRHRGEQPALVAVNDAGRRVALSRDALRARVLRFAAGLAADGVGPGHRVAGFVPNSEHAVIAMLACTWLGATWTSCSPDFGEAGVLDRFGQTTPTVLVACDGYHYAGKRIDTRARVGRIAAALPSLLRVVAIPLLGEPLDGATGFDDYGAGLAEPAPRHLAFDHPLYVMYSSGTTGQPKCIVHGAGGTLLQHWKELALQTDVGEGDVLFFFTTCGWMMWNWLVSGLATGATLLLYDGSPFHPGADALWRLAANEAVTHFGTSPKYLSALDKSGFEPAQLGLPRLRTLLSTGSPLAPEQFDFVYRAVKADVQLASISGGTDILACFALGNPWSPVYRGALQGPGLGMAVAVWDADGRPLHDAPGELVCTQPFPSMPVGFWNDPDGSRYRAAYFERFPGVWHHGDYCQWTAQGGLVISGRSDATLNPGGVRIGTAEIYRVVEALPEVQDAVVVGHRRDGDERVMLFVCLRPGIRLDDALVARLRGAIREQLTPRHVPHRIIACPEVPRTLSGKVTEIAVRDLIHGRKVKNADALANPAALDFFARLQPEDLD